MQYKHISIFKEARRFLYNTSIFLEGNLRKYILKGLRMRGAKEKQELRRCEN